MTRTTQTQLWVLQWGFGSLNVGFLKLFYFVFLNTHTHKCYQQIPQSNFYLLPPRMAVKASLDTLKWQRAVGCAFEL